MKAKPIFDDKISKKMNFQHAIGDFQHDNNIQVKCLSDRILLYIRYGLYKLGNESPSLKKIEYGEDTSDLHKMEEKAIYIYKNYVRANEYYTTKHPSAIAGAVLYIVCVMWGVNRTQINIADLMNCAPVSVATYYRKLRKDMNI